MLHQVSGSRWRSTSEHAFEQAVDSVVDQAVVLEAISAVNQAVDSEVGRAVVLEVDRAVDSEGSRPGGRLSRQPGSRLGGQ